MPVFCRSIVFVRNFANTIAYRAVPILIIAALLSPAVFILFSGTAEASGKKPRKTVTAPQSAPPEPFIIGGQQTNPVLTILAFEALSTITSSFMAMFADESAEVRTSVGTSSESENADSETEAQSAPPQPASIVDFDFDNDGKTDIGRWKPVTSEFEIDPSGGGSNLIYDIGSSTSKFVPGDFNGDGNVDAAVFDSGTWTYKTSPTASAATISLGQSGDIPVPANFGGDGRADAAVFRPSTGAWHIQITGGSSYSNSFGTSGDIPVVGDYDGDGVADLAVFRPSSAYWHVQGSTAGYSTFPWGVSSDVPVPADYDGDGMTDPAVYRGSTGTWYALKSSTSYTTHEIKVWGNYGDQPVPGDYDDDNKADFAVWRPTTGVWYIAKSGGGHEYHTLGVPGDRAVPSAFIKQIGGEVAPYDLAKARLSPKNATGGTDLYSQNFSWGTSLVGLAGRAGLNAGFGMSYNSLVWTKEGSNVHFDTNYDNISPGFRFGFPTIEAPYYLNPAGEGDPFFSYIMVSPSGARTEFRQVGVTDTFESVDSSYLQIKTKITPDPNQPVEEIGLTVRGTDGTQMEYIWIAGAFRCTRILDRNGNYITIDHSEYGQLTKVTDTLGREINVNYSEDLYPTSITQTWKGTNGSGSNTTHTWATFTYTTKTAATDFTGVTNVGPQDDTEIKVLEKVTYSDDSYTKFHYNGYIQVWKVENFAANNDFLNHVKTNLESPAENQTESPKFTSTWNKAANFNGGTDIRIDNDLTPSQSFTLPGSLPNTSGTLITVEMVDHPYNAVSKTIVGASGWQEGLTLATEEHADNIEGGSNARQRWTWNEWTQDDTGSADILNPRITETRVGDSTNVKRITIEYCVTTSPCPTVAVFGLATAVNVYDTDLSTVLKRSETTYNLSSTYTDRRIIGLPAQALNFGRETSGLNLMSKLTYAFDEGNFSDSGLNQNISPIQHDNTNYGSSFITGRANLTSTTRWNVEYPTTSGEAVTSSQKYNTAGAVVSKTDPESRTVKIGYADNYNSTVGVSTWAYPTSLTDPANNSSTVKYRYDIGANIEANSPAPTGQTYGKTTKRIYDSIGRLERDSVYINTTEHAYTRYSRPNPDNGVEVFTHATLVDTDSDGADVDDEVISLTQYDGAGRVRRSRVPHTFSGGTTSTWAGTVMEYDILGRVKRQSVPTEVDNSWVAAGDDYTRDFLWTYQKYDWMGRVVRKINTDGADSPTLNDSDVLISYAGCGCAGGLETTIEGELVPRTDTSGNARRKQKAYSDIIGRTWKTESYEWNGSTVYATAVNTFNGRDQVTQTRQYAGNTSSSTYQDTTATFDGHGRLKTSHRPEQRDSSNNPTSTTYNYNTDDSISSVVDARGATTNYAYNNRGLVEDITWDVPGSSGITDPANVEFAYDNLGNRTSMTDGLGAVAFEYNSLSQLTAETRDFTDTLANAPNGVFKLEYTYTLGGAVKSFTDPYDDEIYYSLDKLGRLGGVTGSTFASVTTYASNITYRAWGALKHLEYGGGNQINLTYNNTLAPDTQITNNISTPSMKIFDRTYDYLADGRLRLADEESSTADEKFDRSFTYDHLGRVKDAKSGVEAHGGTETDLEKLPYRQSYSYNALGNLTGRDSTLWDYAGDWDFSNTFVNNRVTAGAFYDNDGRRTYGDGTYFKFDASGAMNETTRTANYETLLYRDGLGRESKRSQRLWDTEEVEWGESDSKYLIHSSVFGRIVTEAEKTGRKWRTFVMANGESIARQSKNESGSGSLVTYEYRDATGLSAGNVVSITPEWSHAYLREELDGLGNNVGHVAVENPLDEPRNSPSPVDRMAFESMDMGFCNEDGIFGPCDIVETLDRQAGLYAFGELGLQEANGRAVRNRNHPFSIAREILNSLGMFDLHLIRSPGNIDNLQFNYSGRYLNWLIGHQGQVRRAPTIKGATQDQQARVEDAWVEMMNRLGTKGAPSECAKLFGGFEKAMQLLKNTKFSIETLDENAVAETKGKKVQISPTNGFFDNEEKNPILITRNFRDLTLPGGSTKHYNYSYHRISLSAVEQSAFVLLHELGHRAKIFGKFNDDASITENARNNELIWNACFSEKESTLEP